MVALYCYFLLPATATVFYELYHWSQIDFIYWIYAIFKFLGAMLPRWGILPLVSVSSGLLAFGMACLVWRREPHSDDD